jgi:hypothetical protein
VKTSYPNHLDYMGNVVVGGFEPPKHGASDLKSLPFDQTREHYLDSYYYTINLKNQVSNFGLLLI